MEFSKKWKKEETLSRRDKLKEMIKPSEQLSVRVKDAKLKIQVQIKKLNNKLSELKGRDTYLFKKMVTATQKHDSNMSQALSNELLQVRKTAKLLNQTTIILEQIALKLDTLHTNGEIVTTLAPVVGSICNIRSGLQSLIPETEFEIREINSVLSEVVMDAGRIEGLTLNFEIANEDAKKIIQEAELVAEKKIEDNFPKLPNSIKKPDGSLSNQT